MGFSQRYERNKISISDEEQIILKNSRVLVLGCGGLGGYIIEYLARIGVGHITAVDGDEFCASNLNRQLYAKQDNIGLSKAFEAQKRVAEINDDVEVTAVHAMFTPENADDLVAGQNVVVDALDNAEAKLLAAKTAGVWGVPFVHGAISGWCARVYTVMPGDTTMEMFCNGSAGGTEKTQGNLPFTAAYCAALEGAEVVKLLLKRGQTAAGRIVEADLYAQTFDVIEML